jgi:hypothetical protein
VDGRNRQGRRDRRAEEPLQVEVELVRERAEALGRAGRRLEDAVSAYRLALDRAGGALPPQVGEPLLKDIATELYRLVIQRECSGARHGNLDAIRIAYDVPMEAVRRM